MFNQNILKIIDITWFMLDVVAKLKFCLSPKYTESNTLSNKEAKKKISYLNRDFHHLRNCLVSYCTIIRYHKRFHHHKLLFR